MNQKMCVIGWGTVGKATAKTFGITNYYSRSEKNITLEEAAACGYIFICLPTPVDSQGTYYVDDIIALIEKLAVFPAYKNAIVVLRSTVNPGFNQYLQRTLGVDNIVSNPEFLSEDTWEEDAIRPDLVVIGADKPELREKVQGLYSGRFKYNTPLVTDSVTAEMIKITLNGFFTTKVVFANAIYDYAQKTGANYETIKGVLQAHPWGSKNHFTIFHKGGRGAGGKCLGKDMAALANYVDRPLFHLINLENEALLQKSEKK